MADLRYRSSIEEIRNPQNTFIDSKYGTSSNNHTYEVNSINLPYYNKNDGRNKYQKMRMERQPSSSEEFS